MEDRWLKVSEICDYLNVTKETVYKWIEQRDMPGHRVGGVGCSKKIRLTSGWNLVPVQIQ